MRQWDDDGTLRPSELADGLQAHTVYDGYGTGNVFRANVVVGEIPGFGIGLYPANDNVVTCDNAAPGAAKGLVGDNSHAAAARRSRSVRPAQRRLASALDVPRHRRRGVPRSDDEAHDRAEAHRGRSAEEVQAGDRDSRPGPRTG